MVWSKKLKSISGFFVAVLAVGFAAYILWQPFQAVDEKMPQQNPPLLAGESQDSESRNSEANPIEPRTTLQSAQPRGDAGASDQPNRATSQVNIPHDVVLDSYKRDLWIQIQAHPPEFRRPGDPTLDADTAYRLYMYFGNCSVLVSRGTRAIEKIANRAETAGDRSLEQLEGQLDRLGLL